MNPGIKNFFNIDGKNRWVITLEDGTKFIARPIEAKKDENK